MAIDDDHDGSVVGRRKPLSQQSQKIRAAMYGDPAFWRDALGQVLDAENHGICYATYAIDSMDARAGEIWTLFLTDKCVYWCEMAPTGDFTGAQSWARHAEISAIGPCINDSRAVAYIANHANGTTESFIARCRDAREAKSVHWLMMTALDLVLGQPPFVRFSREPGGRVRIREPRRAKAPRL